ncbi:class I SAM-dependent RNA methyltransferase [Algirhabdus cladophorae]|uniref:class I SAM-dependent RNA methyltransferase n=1 Tax=Algirhabdus cladophorae TaxID=3377108 RepID=UPI003B8466F8
MTVTKIQRLNAQALGVDENGQHAAYVLPQENVEITEGVARIVEPSASRVKAPCSHFKKCGGCSLQHASDDFVAEWKVDAVVQALATQGVEVAQRPEIYTSPPASRRRAKLTAKRTKSGAMVGFMSARSHTLLSIPNCRVLCPEIMSGLPMLEALTVMGASRKAQVSLSVTSSAAGLDVDVSGGKPLTDPFRLEVTQFAQRYGLARISWDGELIVTLAPPTQSFGSLTVQPPVGAFLQATQDGEQALAQTVAEAVGQSKSVIDLFAGCGTFAARLVSKAKVHAVEGSQDMLAALDAGWRKAQNVKHLSTEVRDLFRRPLDADELKPYDAIVLDPPRAGAAAQVVHIARAQSPLVVMVSCNPSSFARDAKVLVDGGYRLDRLTVVDQFRWSSHIEAVGVFRRV